MKCLMCQKVIPEGEEYSCIWFDEPDGVRISFAHLRCSEELEDITDQVDACREEAEQKMKGYKFQ